MRGYGLGPLSWKTLVVAAGKGAQFAAVLVALAYLARKWDKSVFGAFQQGWLLISTLTSILVLGLPQSLNYLLPQVDRERGRQIIWMAVALLGAVALPVAFVLAVFPRTAAWLVDNPAIIPFTPALVFLLLANLPGQLLEPLAILRERQKL
ncbi:MAG: hypothetical protein NTW86_22550, partial [Candidatus Sumerlaeota bacterium]|nr:hypothetical protein [Candidatus Sumerlaeota bacterium]